jgi:hypothetical protein
MRLIIEQPGIGDAHPMGISPEVIVMWCTT